MRASMYDDTEFSPREAYPFVDRVMAADDANDPALDGSAVIEVADEGPGLPSGDADNLFRRFYRADASRSRDSGGVGLGLSIVAAIAQAHHGSVSASAGPSGGAVFRITLPLLTTSS